ncbi:MAG: type II secretion system F family protein, partial [Chloroflexia bacterium]|nr:type II secretion system F family protein [Chloroflexia bacterium]
MMMSPLVLIFGVLILGGIGLMAFVLINARRSDAIEERLNQFTERAMTLEEMELEQPFSQRVILPATRSLLTTLGKYGPRQSMDRLKLNLQLAGNPGNITPAMFIGLRVALTLVLGLIIMVVSFSTMETGQAMLYSVIGFALGYMLPVMWLGRKITDRKKAIQKAMPDALDLLCISVEAGLAFDLALQRVTQKWDDELSREFKRVLS